MKFLLHRCAVVIGLLGVSTLSSPAEPTTTEMESRLLEMQNQMTAMHREMMDLQAQLSAMKEREILSSTAGGSLAGTPLPPSAPPASPTPKSKYPLNFYGKIKFDAIADTNDLGASEYTTYVPKDADGRTQTTFTGRETRLGIGVTGPNLGDWTSTAKMETDFYGSAPSSGSGSLRIRLAYVDLSNGQTSVRVGQDWLPVSTLNPSTTNFTIMAYNGNLWGRVPQVTIRQKFSESITGTLATYRCRDEEDAEPDVSCDLTMPWVAGGIQLKGDPFGTGDTALVGVHGAVRNGDVAGRTVTPSLASAEFSLPWRALSLTGEVYYGKGLGAEYLHRGGAFNAAGDPIRTGGGFLQFGIRAADPLRFHLGYGFDDPRDEDLLGDEFYRKSTYIFGNVYCDLTSDLSVVVEGTQIKTTWSDGPKDGFRFQSSMIFLW